MTYIADKADGKDLYNGHINIKSNLINGWIMVSVSFIECLTHGTVKRQGNNN